jgi:hypothetical protein
MSDVSILPDDQL